MGKCVDYWSHLARLLNYCEQTQVYNAINFSDTPYSYGNSTAESMGITMLWCPSDGTISGLRFFETSRRMGRHHCPHHVHELCRHVGYVLSERRQVPAIG